MITVNAFFDDGNAFPLLSKEACDALGLRGRAVELEVSGVAGMKKVVNSICARIQICNKDTGVRRKIWVQVIDRPAGHLQPVDWNVHKNKFDHLRDIPFPEPVPGGIHLMLGCAYPELMAATEADKMGADPSLPIARKTLFGWTAIGPTNPIRSDYLPTVKVVAHLVQQEVLHPIVETFPKEEQDQEDESDLERLVKLQWEHEKLGGDEDVALSKEDCYAIETLKRGSSYHNKRYTMPVCWRPGEPQFKPNYEAAKEKLEKMLKSRLMQGPDARAQYGAVFKAWETKGYIKPLPLGKGKFWVPHFPVQKKGATTTKIRPVMDCRIRLRGGKALNDAVLPGPSFITDIRQILMRFERYPWAVGGGHFRNVPAD